MQMQRMFQQGGELLDDGQAQAQTVFGVTPGVVQLIEFFEYLRLLLDAEAATVVGDIQQHPARILPRAKGDQPGLSVTQGVGQQVAQHPLEQQRIAAHP